MPLWGAAPVPPVQMVLSLVLGILLAPTVWLGHFVLMAYPPHAKLAPTQQQELQAAHNARLAATVPQQASLNRHNARRPPLRMMELPTTRRASAPPAPWATSFLQPLRPASHAQPALSLGRMLQFAQYAHRPQLRMMGLPTDPVSPATEIPRRRPLNL